jgi:hypothetical protein
VQDLGRLFDGQPAEETEFNDTRLPRIEGRKSIERLVERGQIDGVWIGGKRVRSEWDMERTRASLLAALPACEVDEDVSHHARSRCQKMRPVVQLHCVPFDESQKRLVNECSGLKNVARSFPPHVQASLMSQLLVQQR